MNADRDMVRELRRLYLLEHGPDADTASFVDWVAGAVIVPDVGTASLIAFYEGRIAALRATWAQAPEVPQKKPGEASCRQVVVDNYGELVELWDCAPGEEGISLSPDGRAQIFGLPTGMRTERYYWTEAGRAAIIELRRKARKKASK